MTSRKNTVLTGQSRELVIKLRDYFERENNNGGPLIPMQQAVLRVAQALGISTTSVSRITKEKFGFDGSQENKLKTPAKKRQRSSTLNLTVEQEVEIRNHIYNYILRKEPLTLKKLLISLKKEQLFPGQKTFLTITVKKLGFTKLKHNKLVELPEIASARAIFLRQMKDLASWEHIVLVYEGFINIHHCESLESDKGESKKVTSSSKSDGLTVCFAGNSRGFIGNSLVTLKAHKSVANTEQSIGQKFKDWLESEVLKNLTQRSIILVSDSPDHFVDIDKVPTQESSKKDILDWLLRNNIPADMNLLKSEMLDLVERNKPITSYIINELARSYGHRIIKVMKYHGHYNSLEPVLSKMKNFVAKNNKRPFSVERVLECLHQSISDINVDDFEMAIANVKAAVNNDWLRDLKIDHMLDNDDVLEEDSEEEEELEILDEIIDDDSDCHFNLFH